jgi:hypothetical protein
LAIKVRQETKDRLGIRDQLEIKVQLVILDNLVHKVLKATPVHKVLKATPVHKDRKVILDQPEEMA